MEGASAAENAVLHGGEEDAVLLEVRRLRAEVLGIAASQRAAASSVEDLGADVARTLGLVARLAEQASCDRLHCAPGGPFDGPKQPAAHGGVAEVVAGPPPPAAPPPPPWVPRGRVWAAMDAPEMQSLIADVASRVLALHLGAAPGCGGRASSTGGRASRPSPRPPPRTSLLHGDDSASSARALASRRSGRSFVSSQPLQRSSELTTTRMGSAGPHDSRLVCMESAEKLAQDIRAQALLCKSRSALREERRQSLTSVEMRSAEDPLVARIVKHPLFDSVCALMIIFNSALIGWGVEWQVTHAELSDIQKNLGYLCTSFFSVELVLRMITMGRAFFGQAETRGWNIFDFALVALSIVDLIVEQIGPQDGETASLGSAMKTIKMLRIVRVFRVFRFFRELSLLALMIVDSLRSLVWALMMLFIIIYVFAILFTQAALEFIKENGEDDLIGLAEVQRQFGTLARTTYSLVQAMLGGVSWGVVSDALLTMEGDIGKTAMPALFFFYIAFTMLAVLNIITGVFVDNAVETARCQRDFLVQKEADLKEKYIGELRNLFAEMDQDKNGTISLREIQEYLRDPRVRSYFAALGLDASHTERLFDLIDDDESGDVSIDEFLDGCLRLKGTARSIDVHAMMHAQRRLESKLEHGQMALVQRLESGITSYRGASVPERSSSIRFRPSDA